MSLSRSDERQIERGIGRERERDALHTTLFANRLHTQPLHYGRSAGWWVVPRGAPGGGRRRDQGWCDLWGAELPQYGGGALMKMDFFSFPLFLFYYAELHFHETVTNGRTEPAASLGLIWGRNGNARFLEPQPTNPSHCWNRPKPYIHVYMVTCTILYMYSICMYVSAHWRTKTEGGSTEECHWFCLIGFKIRYLCSVVFMI